jgi:hypothetical protein
VGTKRASIALVLLSLGPNQVLNVSLALGRSFHLDLSLVSFLADLHMDTIEVL